MSRAGRRRSPDCYISPASYCLRPGLRRGSRAYIDGSRLVEYLSYMWWRPKQAHNSQITVKVDAALQAARTEYARRVYDRVMDWYKVAETKAQLILTVNGVFITIGFGIVSAKPDGVSVPTRTVGPETWGFLALAVSALAGAIGAAAACLLSRHRHNIKIDFKRLGIDPDERDELVALPVETLWYFGHLASLPFRRVVNSFDQIDEDDEFKILAFHVVGLSRVVLRKHRLVNAGWLLTSVALLSLLAAITSYAIRLSS
jgi:hypothetical protein